MPVRIKPFAGSRWESSEVCAISRFCKVYSSDIQMGSHFPGKCPRLRCRAESGCLSGEQAVGNGDVFTPVAPQTLHHVAVIERSAIGRVQEESRRLAVDAHNEDAGQPVLALLGRKVDL